jgi:hypothetical protein
LRKFNLGTIPASVTPPRSRRRAAWFAATACLTVVAGLVFAAAALVGKPKSSETIDALPGYPSLPMFIDVPSEPATTTTTTPTTSRQPGRSIMISSSPHRMTSTVQITGIPTTDGTSPAPSPAPPVRWTAPKHAFAMNDPGEIGDRTEAFYKQVTANPAAAYEMTAGEMRLQGEERFKQRYADIESVEVRTIEIDPNQGTTVSEAKVTKKDGSTVTERRRLKFTSGSNPKISSEVAR